MSEGASARLDGGGQVKMGIWTGCARGMVLTPPFQHVVDLSFDWRHVGPKFRGVPGINNVIIGAVRALCPRCACAVRTRPPQSPPPPLPCAARTAP